ncbi:MAG: cytochrome c oxidase subunit II [Cyanobacteria bacterium CRU_2_1]|nr:cytochrome c oxidase subunit II [Cyanobacteria bacterium RU_5_0]NJR61639.1 cytochrome c oxidase subunit II [Cyanobacteria bacterium CRU_2_1]
MKIPSNISALLVGITLTLVSLWIGQNHGLLPIAASKEAELVDELFNAMMTISVGLFLLVQGVLIIAVFKFRRRPGDLTDAPPIHGNIPLEILWTAIPTVIVLLISVYSFDVYQKLGGFDPNAIGDSGAVQVAMLPGEELSTPLINPSKTNPTHKHLALGIGASPEAEGKPADLVVNVMGMQYAWLFTYPEIGTTTGELHVPLGKDIQLNIKAQDVLHAFWLPEFRIKQDAIPGQESQLRFRPQRVGEYPVVCAELCGPYHGGMVTKLFVENQQDYDNWLHTQIASHDPGQTVIALGANPPSDTDFLAPFVSELGVTNEILQQLNPHYPA